MATLKSTNPTHAERTSLPAAVRDELFARAEEAARSVMFWRRQAAAWHPGELGCNRRQALAFARRHEAVVVSLAGRAERAAARLAKAPA